MATTSTAVNPFATVAAVAAEGAPASEPAPGAEPAPPTLEQSVLLASQQAAQIANIFLPAAADAIRLGVAIEPIIHSFVGMFAGIFHHHVRPKPKL